MWKDVTNHGSVNIHKNYHVPNNLMSTKEDFIERVHSGNLYLALNYTKLIVHIFMINQFVK